MNKEKQIEILEDLKKDVEENILIEVRGIYYKPLLDYITNLQEENKKLNYIINELEKDLIDGIEYWEIQEKIWIDCGFTNFGEKEARQEILNKLQQLRGKDNE